MAAEQNTAQSMPDVGLRTVTAQEAVQRPQIQASPGFGAWLRAQGGSLVFTTYQSSRAFFLWGREDGGTSAQERIVGSAMGLAVGEGCLWIANKEQAWCFANVGPKSDGTLSFDAVYMPRKGHFLGPCDTHDIACDVIFGGQTHELLFVNTNFSCIAALDRHYSFRPLWKPDFVSGVSAGDRCHLNGMGMRDGELAYATACGTGNTPTAWRQTKGDGGVVIDVRDNRILCSGLSMPHSPRWHDGRLWVLNSGEGDFGYVDNGRFVPVGLCPGFARGLCFVGGLAVIGMSMLRGNSFGAGLRIKQRLEDRQIPQHCGLLVIDPATGRLLHWVTIIGAVTELFDVQFLPGVLRPFTPGFSEPALHRAFFDIAPGSLPVEPFLPSSASDRDPGVLRPVKGIPS